MTVLFGTTMRSDSDPLAEIAARLALRLGLPLRLVHVCEDPRAPLVLGTDQEHVLGPVREDLDRQAERLRAATGATVRPHLTAGSAIEALASVAEFELATALLVGASQRRWRHVPERLARITPVPLLVLRAPERLAGWLRDEHPLRVLVGADLGRAAEAARRFAAQLVALGPAAVEVLMVAPPDETHARLGIAPPPRDQLAPEADAVLRNELRQTGPSTENARIEVLGARGPADAHLLDRTREGDFDLVVVGQRSHSFVQQIWHGSVTRSVIHHAPVSVACVPVPIGEADTSFRPPRTIVVAAAMTEIDHRSVAHAIGLAEPRAAIHVVHVVEESGETWDVSDARAEASSHLQTLTRHWSGAVSLHTHVLEGDPAEQLLAIAERLGADLLVLGARRRSAISRALLGSLARELVDRCRFPIVLVPGRDA
jgi:nucleotide-binding universal stress UspA family protein